MNFGPCIQIYLQNLLNRFILSVLAEHLTLYAYALSRYSLAIQES
jgi:hypothetical protein